MVGLQLPVSRIGTTRPGRFEPRRGRLTFLMVRYARSGRREDFDLLAKEAMTFLRNRVCMEISQYRDRLPEDEVLQETLLNIYRYGKSFRPRGPRAFEAWSSRIVRNVVVRFLGRGGGPICFLAEIEEDGSPAPPEADPFQRVLLRETRRHLRRRFALLLCAYFGAFQALTSLQRRVLHLVEIEGKKYREVGEELGMRSEAVKMVVYRARRSLHAALLRAAAG